MVPVAIDKVSDNATIICKQYYVDIILREIGVIGHRYKTYRQANKSSYELIDEITECTKRYKKHYLSCTGFLKYKRIQQMHDLQSKFLNLFQISLS